MPRWLSRFLPKSLVGQLLLALALALLIAQSINLALLARGRSDGRLNLVAGAVGTRVVDAVDRAARGAGSERTPMRWRRDREESPRRGAAQWLDTAPTAPENAREWPELAERVRTTLSEAGLETRTLVAWRVGPPGHEGHENHGPRFDGGRIDGNTIEARDALRRMRGRVVVAMQFADPKVGNGHWLAVRASMPVDNGALSAMIVGQSLLIFLILLGAVLLVARHAAQPLKALSVAAREPIAGAVAPTPLPETGPADVRDVTAGFNQLRARVAAMLVDKDRMLGAIGHDLRTPLASLRVRVEGVGDDRLREAMIASIDEMAAMLTDIVALARSGQGTEAVEPVAPGALLSDLATDYRGMGRAVEFDRGDAADDGPVLAVRLVPLRRALRNLIDNALIYGGDARLHVETTPTEVALVVTDRGPGIPDDRIAAMLEPFARAEPSRNRATGGAGLGLSLANTVAELEGGRLRLANRTGGGLDARIILPRG